MLNRRRNRFYLTVTARSDGEDLRGVWGSWLKRSHKLVDILSCASNWEKDSSSDL